MNIFKFMKLSQHVARACLIAALLFYSKDSSGYSWVSSPDGSLNSRMHFLYTIVRDGVPYVIINNAEELYKIQSSLLFSFQKANAPHRNYPLSLDLSNMEIIVDLPLYWGADSIRCFEIIGDADNLRNNVGFCPGDKLRVENVSRDSNGKQAQIIVDKILFHADWGFSFVILKCKPVDRSSDFFSNIAQTGAPLIAFTYIEWIKDTPCKPSSKAIPPLIQQKVKALAEAFFPANLTGDFRQVTTVPIQKNCADQQKTYYATVASYGEKGKTGVLYLIDGEGNILQKADNTDFTEILSVTDINRNGTPELIIFFGDGYGGGIALLTFESDHQASTPMLVEKTRMATVFD